MLFRSIALSKNSVFHKRTKHIDTKFHYIRELVSNGEIVLQHCRTEEQLADIITKPLAQNSFEKFRKFLGMQEHPAVEIKGECWNLISNCPDKALQQKSIGRDSKGSEVKFDGNF